MTFRLPRWPWLIPPTIALVLIGMVVQIWMTFHRQQATVREIERLGGRVVVEPGGPDWLRKRIGDERMAEDADFRSFAQAHHALLTAYRAQDWPTARRLLAAQEPQAARFGLSRLYALYDDRLDVHERHPPGEEWDGVFVALEKSG